MGAGSGGSAMLALKARPMLDHDFSPLFKLAHMLKDLRLCLDEGQTAGVAFPAAAAARELYTAGMGRDLADQDFAAVLGVLEDLGAIRV
jgi:2-hydroxy-3-oxopropionate reductase